MNKSYLLVLVCLSLVAISCKEVKDITYFPEVGVSDSMKVMDILAADYQAKIIPDDELVIIVSAEDPTAVAIFNMPAVSYIPSGTTQMSTTQQLQTYLVDADGEITFPVLGRLKVAGLTRKGVEDMIRLKIENYVHNPIVNVANMMDNVTILGEVNNPGIKHMGKERVSIIEALGYAGDISIHGQRKNVLIVREEDGKRNFVRMDMTKADIFASPYYYIKKNDIIYVEPNKEKKAASKYNAQKQTNIAIISTVLSGVSIISSMVMAFTLKN